MMNVNIFDTSLFPYIEGQNLVDKMMTLTICKIQTEKMKDHKGRDAEKYVLYFRETKKGLVLNKTNAKRIAILYGCQTGEWDGKQITLYAEEVKAFGEIHNAVRVAEAVPGNGSQVDDSEWMHKQPSKGRFFGGIKKDFGIEPAIAAKMLKEGGYTNGYDPILAPEMYEYLSNAPMPQVTAESLAPDPDEIEADQPPLLDGDEVTGAVEEYYSESDI